MPVEIFEMVIRANIDEERKKKKEKEEDERYVPCKDLLERLQMNRSEQFNEILNRRKER